MFIRVSGADQLDAGACPFWGTKKQNHPSGPAPPLRTIVTLISLREAADITKEKGED